MNYKRQLFLMASNTRVIFELSFDSLTLNFVRTFKYCKFGKKKGVTDVLINPLPNRNLILGFAPKV